MHNKLQVTRQRFISPHEPCRVVTPIDNFTRTTVSEVPVAIRTNYCKTCSLDPRSSDRIKQNTDERAITANARLMEGVMPTELNGALVHPLLKKPPLCKDTLGNCRPVSN